MKQEDARVRSVREHLAFLHDFSDWLDTHLVGTRLLLAGGIVAVSGGMMAARARQSTAVRPLQSARCKILIDLPVAVSPLDLQRGHGIPEISK